MDIDIHIAKFIAIVLCFLMAATCREHALGKKDSSFLVAALACTLVADFFLVILLIYPVGLVFFCIAQILYVVRFGGLRALRFAALTAILPVVYLAVNRDLLVTLAIGYAQLFLLSYGSGIRAVVKGVYPKTNSILIVTGLTLFVLCDISVAIWNLWRMGITENREFANLANSAIWLFYAPSQVCLALSGRKFGETR